MSVESRERKKKEEAEDSIGRGMKKREREKKDEERSTRQQEGGTRVEKKVKADKGKILNDEKDDKK